MSSGVTTQHPEWKEHIYTWCMIRDALEGEDRIKFKSEQYLPIPGGMLMDDMKEAPSTQRTVVHPLLVDDYAAQLSFQYNPNYHQNAAYASYKSRARFPNLVSFLYRGLLGLASADSPTIALPSEMEYLLQKASLDGLSLSELFAKVLGEVLLTGRVPLTIDPQDDGKILIIDYAAERFINWKEKNRQLVLTVFVEDEDQNEERVDETDDPAELFEHDQELVYFVQRLDPVTGDYIVEKYYDDDSQPETHIPSVRGRTLKEIPTVVLGSMNNTLDPDPPPMAPVANTSVQIYQKDADLSQAEYLTCNPTMFITGVNQNESPNIQVGATVVYILSNPQAKVAYTQTDTSAFQFVLNHINTLYEQAIIYGAQLLDSSKKSAETAETTRLKQTAAGATLRSVVTTVGTGFEKLLKLMGNWMGLPQEKIDQIKFRPITEFGLALTPQEQKQLVDSWMAGAISHMTVLTNFRKAGILGEGRSEEDELDAIESEQPPTAPSGNINQNTGAANAGGNPPDESATVNEPPNEPNPTNS